MEMENVSKNQMDPVKARRLATIIGGSVLTLYGLRRRSFDGLLLAIIGGGFIYNGATQSLKLRDVEGHLPIIRGGGANISVPYGKGYKFEESIVVDKPADELYRYWRNLENLPRIMRHLESVEWLDEKRTRWVARGPAGIRVAWDGEIVNEEENKLIGWRSLPGSAVEHAGSVHFESLPDGQTRIHVILRYIPPAGSLGMAIATMFGKTPEQQIREDLCNFKHMMETGELFPGECQHSQV